MTSSYTFSASTTFTITHARHIAAKVATDLKRMQRFYGEPADSQIAAYEQELTELLKGGYVDKVTYGFHRDGLWIPPTLNYTAQDLAGSNADDNDPGRIWPGAEISGASFYSYLVYSFSWFSLSEQEKASVEKELPFKRTDAAEPGIDGYLLSDRTYSAGGRALHRASVRAF